MKELLIPILYAAAAAAALLAPATLPPGQPGAAALLLAPILYLAGSRLRSLLGSGLLAPALPAAIGQVVLGTVILGGAAHLLGASGESAIGLAQALLLGLALSLGDLPRGREGQATAKGSARLPAILEAHAVLSLLMAVPLLAVIAEELEPAGRRPGIDYLLPFLDLLRGFGAGAAVGLAGLAALRPAWAAFPRSLIQIALCESAAVAAAAAGGSIPLAVMTAGFMGWRARRAVTDFPATAAEGASTDTSGRDLADFAAVLAGVGLLVLAGTRVDPEVLLPALPIAAAIWAGSAVLRILVQFGLGGIQRLFHPSDIPARWLPAIGWASVPGAACLGFYLITRESAEAGAGASGEDAVILLATALALIVQGTTAPLALLRARRSLASPGASDRWEMLTARAISLAAERGEVEELRSRGEVDDEAASAMADAIAETERRVGLAREELAAAEPKLKGMLLSRAVRSVLSAGLQAVAAARARGDLDPSVADAAERDIARRWFRSGSSTLREVLSAEPDRAAEGAEVAADGHEAGSEAGPDASGASRPA